MKAGHGTFAIQVLAAAKFFGISGGTVDPNDLTVRIDQPAENGAVRYPSRHFLHYTG